MELTFFESFGEAVVIARLCKPILDKVRGPNAAASLFFLGLFPASLLLILSIEWNGGERRLLSKVQTKCLEISCCSLKNWGSWMPNSIFYKILIDVANCYFHKHSNIFLFSSSVHLPLCLPAHTSLGYRDQGLPQDVWERSHSRLLIGHTDSLTYLTSLKPGHDLYLCDDPNPSTARSRDVKIN